MEEPAKTTQHDLFPHNVYRGICIPIITSVSRYQELNTDAFTPRPSDVIIATYSKSGTTWLQTMVYNLVGCPNGPLKKLDEQVPWLQDPTVSLERIQEMRDVRVFKTHDYWSWLPENVRETSRIIYCHRNPKDWAVSYFHHMKFMSRFYGKKIEDLSFGEYFEQVATKKDVSEYGLWEDHIMEWMPESSRDNILALTYEDLTENTERELRKIVAFLGLKVTEAHIQCVLEQSKFATMRKNDAVNYNWISADEGPECNFIRKGGVGGWKETLSEEQSRHFGEVIRKVEDATGASIRCRI